MKSKKLSGHTLTLSKGTASVAGVPYKFGTALVAVAVGNYAANESGEYESSGVKLFANDAARSVGDIVDWSIAGGKLANAGLGDFELGVVVKDAANTDECEVMVNSNPGPGPSYS